MNVYELFAANRSLIEIMKKNNLSPADMNNFVIYEEFKAMKSVPHKTVYCVVTLAEKYKCSQRKIYNIIEQFRREVEL